MTDEVEFATWNHRVFHEVLPDGDDWFTIREAHYGLDKINPHSWTENAIAPAGNTLDELRGELERMLRCLERPTLEDDEALAAAAREGGDVKQAPGEAPQSGLKGNAQPGDIGNG